MADLVELKEIEERVILVAVSTEEESLAAASLDELDSSGDISGQGKDRRGEGARLGAECHWHCLRR